MLRLIIKIVECLDNSGIEVRLSLNLVNFLNIAPNLLQVLPVFATELRVQLRVVKTVDCGVFGTLVMPHIQLILGLEVRFLTL